MAGQFHGALVHFLLWLWQRAGEGILSSGELHSFLSFELML
jgi:hypothetical protein